MVRTIDYGFQKVIEGNKGAALILAGSGSDQEHIGAIGRSLEEFGVPYQVRICSAHKQPNELRLLMEQLNGIEGSVAIIAVAGGTDALSGTVSWGSYHPVISCPPDALNESCLRNPPGSSNSYVTRPENVGRYVAQMWSGINPDYRKRISRNIAAKLGQLGVQDDEFKDYKAPPKEGGKR